MSSQQLSPMALSIHSHLSDSQTEQKKWNEEYDKLQTEYRRLQDILQQQTDSEGRWVKLILELEEKVKKAEKANADLQDNLKTELQKMKKGNRKDMPQHYG